VEADVADCVERIWRALARQGGDDDALRPGFPPHITVAALPDFAPAGAA
jgi:hypothetical protein